MADVLLAAGAATALISLGLAVGKLWDLVHHRHDRLRRLLGVTLAMGAFAVSLQPVSARVDQLLGLLDVCRLVGNVLAVAIVATGHAFLLHTLHPGPATRRRVRNQYLIMVACAAALIGAYALTPAPYRTDDPFVRGGDYYASVHPPPAPYLVVYLGYMLWWLPQVGRLCARYARVARRGPVRLALRMIAAGCLLNFVNVGLKLANLAVRDRPAVSAALYRLTFGTYAVAVLALVIGVMILAWGRWLRLDQLAEHVQAWRACRRLRPLWVLVSGAAPQVTLGDWPRPRGRPGALSGARMRLIRMTTEILDGYAELCPWTNRGVAAEARAAATRLGLTGERLEAAVEARVVAEAVAAAGSDPPAAGDTEIVDLPSPRAATAGDAGTEVAWLIAVAAQLPPVAGRRPRQMGYNGPVRGAFG
ncbi:MAB_1171c family putative transporter [Actinoplanes sp. NPDC049599]|uniref:MAB_1171c family putative transporter n=1 Tax=Actinoplanes sp. NPDC049599 TaxID=3363903 RepID=UPI00378C9D44